MLGNYAKRNKDTFVIQCRNGPVATITTTNNREPARWRSCIYPSFSWKLWLLSTNCWLGSSAWRSNVIVRFSTWSYNFLLWILMVCAALLPAPYVTTVHFQFGRWKNSQKCTLACERMSHSYSIHSLYSIVCVAYKVNVWLPPRMRVCSEKRFTDETTIIIII